jgi:hypothetical protein
MLKQPLSRKLYKGQAVALGGFIERPMPEVIQSQAAAAIPISGGFDSARAEGFNHREIVSFRSARAHVTGHESADGKHLETLSTCVVEGLDILGVVTAERVVARLVGSHVVQPKWYPIVTPSGSYFQGLHVCGREVRCKFIGDAFDKLESGRDAAATLRTQFPLQDQIIQEDGWAAKGFLPISLCADLHIGDQPCKPGQNVIEIPHFGRIYLGELIICKDSYRLTMLRVELGCPVEGQFDVASVEGEPHLMP